MNQKPVVNPLKDRGLVTAMEFGLVLAIVVVISFQRASAKTLFLEEASGVVLLHEDRFAVVVGDDTKKALWVVETQDSMNRTKLSFPNSIKKMSDLEALTKIPGSEDGTFIAICSQSRTKSGSEVKKGRNRIVRMELSLDGKTIVGAKQGDGLRSDLIAHLSKARYSNLIDKDVLNDKNPLDGGLNVEGLAAWNGQLLIGLREPSSSKGDAVIVTLENAEGLFNENSPEDPRFGDVYFLPVRPNEGIRGMTTIGGKVLILVGSNSAEDSGDIPFRLLLWVPSSNKPPVEVKDDQFGALERPEGIAVDGYQNLVVVQDLKDQSSANPEFQSIGIRWPKK